MSKFRVWTQEKIPREAKLNSSDFKKPHHVEVAKDISDLAERTQHILKAICKSILQLIFLNSFTCGIGNAEAHITVH